MTTEDTVLRQLTQLKELTVSELIQKYKELFGVPPASARKVVLYRRLAYKIQEVHYGGLPDDEKKFLEDVASKDQASQLIPASKKPTTKLMPGTRFVRKWQNKTYEVNVTTDGKLEYAGRIFTSLSAIAKEITGTHWNGRAFFGLAPRGRNAGK